MFQTLYTLSCSLLVESLWKPVVCWAEPTGCSLATLLHSHPLMLMGTGNYTSPPPACSSATWFVLNKLFPWVWSWLTTTTRCSCHKLLTVTGAYGVLCLSEYYCNRLKHIGMCTCEGFQGQHSINLWIFWSLCKWWIKRTTAWYSWTTFPLFFKASNICIMTPIHLSTLSHILSQI